MTIVPIRYWKATHYKAKNWDKKGFGCTDMLTKTTIFPYPRPKLFFVMQTQPQVVLRIQTMACGIDVMYSVCMKNPENVSNESKKTTKNCVI